MCIEMGDFKMKFKKTISLVVGVAFISAFAVCPAFAEPESSRAYVAPQKEHGPVSGTLDYLESIVDVTREGTRKAFGSATSVVPRCCGERATYRPSVVMNRGARWRRSYKR
jgi:hypothetical protein